MKRFGRVTGDPEHSGWYAQDNHVAFAQIQVYTPDKGDEETGITAFELIGYMLYNDTAKQDGTVYPDKQISKNAVPIYIRRELAAAALPDKLNIKQQLALDLYRADNELTETGLQHLVDFIMTLK